MRLTLLLIFIMLFRSISFCNDYSKLNSLIGGNIAAHYDAGINFYSPTSNYSDRKNYHLMIGPSFVSFVSGKTAIGIGISYSFYKYTDSQIQINIGGQEKIINQTSFKHSIVMNPKLRYYLYVKEAFGIFLDNSLNLGFEYWDMHDSAEKFFRAGINIGPGISYIINESMLLQAYIGNFSFDYIKSVDNKDDGLNCDISTLFNGLQFGLLWII